MGHVVAQEWHICHAIGVTSRKAALSVKLQTDRTATFWGACVSRVLADTFRNLKQFATLSHIHRVMAEEDAGCRAEI